MYLMMVKFGGPWRSMMCLRMFPAHVKKMLYFGKINSFNVLSATGKKTKT